MHWMLCSASENDLTSKKFSSGEGRQFIKRKLSLSY